MSKQGDAEKAANAMFERFGYMVVGFKHSFPAIGDTISHAWYQIDQPFTVIAETNRAEWDLQRSIGEAVTGRKTVASDYPGGRFFRVVTD